MFDSQADIAAVVYRAGDNPDALLRAFADDLRRSGCRAVGLIQAGTPNACARDTVSAVALPTGASVSLRHDRGSPATGCHLDAGALAEAQARLATAIADGADLVIINRFGKLEAAGGGFAAEIRQAVGAEIPVVIAVPHHLFMTWTRFCSGMGVKLACAREPLDAWWRTVSRPPHAHSPRLRESFCEAAK